MERKFHEFCELRESDYSLKHELVVIERSSLLPVSCWVLLALWYALVSYKRLLVQIICVIINIGVFSKWNRILLNSANSGNLINHLSMNWTQFNDPVSKRTDVLKIFLK